MLSVLTLFSLISTMAMASPITPFRRDNAVSSSICPRYTIIDTRGTTEKQGPSHGFLIMNANITSQLSGGDIYNTIYPAALDQNTTLGTADIVNHVQTTLASDPERCFILQGYSQGATATTNALRQLNGPNFDAVKGVFLIGNPLHKAGLACNIDMYGGETTLDVNGALLDVEGHIPDEWVSKTMDMCNFADGVCDTTHGVGINKEHLAYPSSDSAQSIGATFIISKLTQ